MGNAYPAPFPEGWSGLCYAGECHLISFLPYPCLLSGWALLGSFQLLTLADIVKDKAAWLISWFYFVPPLLCVNSNPYVVVSFVTQVCWLNRSNSPFIDWSIDDCRGPQSFPCRCFHLSDLEVMPFTSMSFIFLDRVSMCSPGWAWGHYVAQAGLQLGANLLPPGGWDFSICRFASQRLLLVFPEYSELGSFKEVGDALWLLFCFGFLRKGVHDGHYGIYLPNI